MRESGGFGIEKSLGSGTFGTTGGQGSMNPNKSNITPKLKGFKPTGYQSPMTLPNERGSMPRPSFNNTGSAMNPYGSITGGMRGTKPGGAANTISRGQSPYGDGMEQGNRGMGMNQPKMESPWGGGGMFGGGGSGFKFGPKQDYWLPDDRATTGQEAFDPYYKGTKPANDPYFQEGGGGFIAPWSGEFPPWGKSPIMGQGPEMPRQNPNFGNGTGSRSRTSTDWKRRNPNDGMNGGQGFPSPMNNSGPYPNRQY